MHHKIAHIYAKRVTDTNPITIGFVSVLLLFNCQRWDYNTRRYTVQSQNRANECQFCANSEFFINQPAIYIKNSIKMCFILKHGFVQMLPEPSAHSAGSCEAVNG